MLRYLAFSLLVLGAPSAAFLALRAETAEAAGPAMLVFILAPAVAALLCSRGLPPTEERPVSGAGSAIALAFAVVTAITAIDLGLALATGAVTRGLGWSAEGALRGAASGVITSTLEELGWAAGGTRIARATGGRDGGVLALGLVWAAWHLVVAAFGPPEAVAAMFGTNQTLDQVRIGSFALGCVAFRFLLTALRDRADNLWPAAAGHVAGNLWLGMLIGGGAIHLNPTGPWAFFPGPTGLGFLGLTGLAWLWLGRR